MWKMTIFRKKRPGFALVFTVLIALAMIIPVMILASNAISRRKAVSGEMVSDRALSVADATVDKSLAEINEFNKTLQSNDPIIKEGKDYINDYYKDDYASDPENTAKIVKETTAKYIVAYLLTKLNGGTVHKFQSGDNPEDYFSGDDYASANFAEGDGSIWDIEDNVVTYLYNIQENRYYAVVNSDTSPDGLAPVSNVGIEGDISSKPIAPVDGISPDKFGSPKDGIERIDPNYTSDNHWIEIDMNVEYVDPGEPKIPYSSKFLVHVSSYPLSKSQNIGAIKRNILAEASLSALTTSDNSSGGDNNSNDSNFPAAFQYAVWSGGDTIVNGGINIEAANINTDGSYSVLDTGGDLYGKGDITLNGYPININGYVVTSKEKGDGPFNDPIIKNGFDLQLGGEKYGVDVPTPDFEIGKDGADNNDTRKRVRDTAFSKGVYPSTLRVNGSGYNINVNGISTKYYVDGDVSTNGNGTINFYPIESSPAVAWYVNGDLSVNGDTTLVFNSPGIVWVHGDIRLNGDLKIVGSGTIVSDGRITINGSGNITYNNDKDMFAFISEANQPVPEDSNPPYPDYLKPKSSPWGIILNGTGHYDSIFYAPYSDVVINGACTIYGTVVGGRGGDEWPEGIVALNGNSNVIFDTRLAGYGNPVSPPLPQDSGNVTDSDVKCFTLNTIYRLSWKEVISHPVTENYIKTFATKNLEFIFPPPPPEGS